MDFTSNRGVQPSASRTSAGNTADTSNNNSKDSGGKKNRMRDTPRLLKLIFVLLLFAGTLIVVGIIALLLINPGNEARFVEKDKYQAVFLDNSSTPYFGRINSLNDDYIELVNIYYLNVAESESVQPADSDAKQNVTLRKLGCELHGPTDRMVINREHVVFWENLRSDGKVSKAITEWIENNPQGLVCENGNATEESGQGSTDSTTNGTDDSDTTDTGDQSTSNGQ
jgi:hypothetical protein